MKEFVEKRQFKSYEQLKARLDKVLGFDGGAAPIKSKAEDTVLKDDVPFDTSTNADDEDLDYFKSLANQE